MYKSESFILVLAGAEHIYQNTQLSSLDEKKRSVKFKKLPNRRTTVNSTWSQVEAAWVLHAICIYDSHGVCAISWKLAIIIQLLLFTEYLTSAKNIPEYFTCRCFKSSCYLIIVVITKSGESSIITARHSAWRSYARFQHRRGCHYFSPMFSFFKGQWDMRETQIKGIPQRSLLSHCVSRNN